MKEFIEILKVIILGIVEGITEWLPVSSTGHMILVDEFLTLKVSEGFLEMFLVVIQLGAILAVPVLFWKRLFPFGKKNSKEEKKQGLFLWLKVIVGAIPAAVAGLFLDDLLDKYCYNFPVVAAALIVYGIAFIVIELVRKKCGKTFRVESVYDLSFKDALVIGAFQTISLVPGTSRSGSTILGGMLTGISRTASAEFSFFMAIPIMLGASGLKLFKFALEGGFAETVGFEWILLAIGMVVSFAVSLVVIDFLMGFVKKHSFIPFGIYRVVLGGGLLVYFFIKTFA